MALCSAELSRRNEMVSIHISQCAILACGRIAVYDDLHMNDLSTYFCRRCL